MVSLTWPELPEFTSDSGRQRLAWRKRGKALIVFLSFALVVVVLPCNHPRDALPIFNPRTSGNPQKIFSMDAFPFDKSRPENPHDGQ
jgi:hypothetical protein